jgi:hypothetical protein
MYIYIYILYYTYILCTYIYIMYKNIMYINIYIYILCTYKYIYIYYVHMYVCIYILCNCVYIYYVIVYIINMSFWYIYRLMVHRAGEFSNNNTKTSAVSLSIQAAHWHQLKTTISWPVGCQWAKISTAMCQNKYDLIIAITLMRIVTVI